ncbi:nucleotidyltransferase [Actibacterium pelagium]|uniref:Nucleotidyltransferase n=2 Tax=Actibacterium pelagium TaxID=2029103 RepID=A0A917AIL8_9RHOB|nr:nucleotidyltransferase [Actibacterium pelagium]
MLFAAGFGTRMKPLTLSRPKPLIKVAGKALLDHALDQVDAAGMGRIVVNSHYLSDQIANHLAPRPDIAISDEQPDILDTGGGLRKALPLLEAGPVLTMNTDAVWTGANAIDQLRAAWNPDLMDALLLLVPTENAIGHTGSGDFVPDDKGRLTRGPGLVYSGVQIVKTDGLAAIEEDSFSLNLLWNKMIAEGRLYGTAHTGGWCDVGHPGGIKLAETMLAEVRDV